jgi:predicted RNA-binding Zn-ribbon protein involved in translation (DUF1610 family)
MPDIPVCDFADELIHRLAEVEGKASKIKTEMGFLAQRREQALVAGSVTASVELKNQISNLQQQLEDFEIVRAAVQAKLRVYDQNASKAAKLRDQTSEFWEEGRALIDEFAKMQVRARTLYKKALELEDKISGLGREHLRLVGRDMRGPPSITGIVYQLGAFAASNVPDVKALPEWKYTSDEEIAAKHKKELDEKLAAHEAKIAKAEEYAQPCPQCGTRMVVDRKSGHTDTPGQSFRGDRSHIWNLICPKCGTHVTAPIAETKKQ